MSVEEKVARTGKKASSQKTKPTGLEETVLEKLRTLPAPQQQEVLDFVEFLQQKNVPEKKPPLRSPKGLLEHLNIDISEEDFKEARREMWANFPRDITM
jgi:hypothetical protein